MHDAIYSLACSTLLLPSLRHCGGSLPVLKSSFFCCVHPYCCSWAAQRFALWQLMLAGTATHPRLDAVIVPCCRDGWQRRPRTWRDWGNPWPRSASACSTLLGERGWLLQRPLSWRVELAGSGDLMLLLQMQHCGSQPLQQWPSNPRLSAAAPACWLKRARLCLLACSMGPARRSRQH